MGIELVFAELLLLQLLATEMFGRFEIETPATKKVAKWLLLDSVTLALFFRVGHYSMLLPVLLMVVGASVHLNICRKHGFDPLRATPRRKYYQFRGWKWEE